MYPWFSIVAGVISLHLSRSAGFPPLSPSRTVHATFTAHDSCNSVNYLSF